MLWSGTMPSSRVGRRPALTAAALAVILLATAECAAAVVKIDGISLTVADLVRTERFYHGGLGFETVSRQHKKDLGLAQLLGVKAASVETLTMRLGGDEVEFIQFQKPGRHYPKHGRSPDLWFQHFAIVVRDMEQAYRHLQRVPFAPISESGPRTLPPENGSVKAFKFRDPDGHPLELLYFPPGQGRPVWREHPTDRLFLGIDHTAIGVSDTAASKSFYVGILGMSESYATINRGREQEALDGTFNAVVRITGLRPIAPDGPGIEFLDYRTPPTGRPAPVDMESNDLTHVHLSMMVDDLDQQVNALEQHDARFVSPGIVALKNGRRAAMVRDPDGHTLLLKE